MTTRRWQKGIGSLVAIGLMIVLGGCGLQLTMTTQPPNPRFGQNVRFDLQVTNQSACPRANVTTIIVPFVPEAALNALLDEIPDADVRDQVAAFINALCTGGTLEVPDDTGFTCEIIAGELVCTMDGNLMSNPSTTESAKIVLASTPGGDVTCEAAGDTVSCRVPKGIVEEARQQSAGGGGALIVPDMMCGPAGPLAFCTSPFLDPNSVTNGTFEIPVQSTGLVRSFAFSFPDTFGVCRDLDSGASVPCDAAADCPGLGNDCRSAICQGGTEAGRGCTLDADCGGGNCVSCSITDGQSVALGLACAQNQVGVPAPAATPGGLGALAAALTLLGGIGIRRYRHTLSR